jgi:purine nucleoside permease
MRLISALLLLVTAHFACAQPSAAKPIEIKVVVVNMFEAGADTGDVPGEYQYWVEREHLDTVLPFPQGYHDLRLNAQTGVLGLLTGVGTARATASVMASVSIRGSI